MRRYFHGIIQRTGMCLIDDALDVSIAHVVNRILGMYNVNEFTWKCRIFLQFVQFVTRSA